MDRVTVLMSVYNEKGRYLQTSIESILHQTHKNIEFIVVDDGSTASECLSLLDKYQASKDIILIRNEKNLGLTESLNKGIRQASGSYLARIDSNDIAHPSRLEEQLLFMKQHSEYALLGSWSYLINEDDEIVGQKKFYTDYLQIRKNILRFNFFTHSSLFFDLQKLRALKGYASKMKKAQDYELILRTAARYPVAILPQFLCFYRLLSSGISERDYKQQEKFAVQARWSVIVRNLYPFIEIWKILPATISFLFIPKKIKLLLIKAI